MTSLSFLEQMSTDVRDEQRGATDSLRRGARGVWGARHSAPQLERWRTS
jgi:hypothetical protein